jgi:hypothetical protein
VTGSQVLDAVPMVGHGVEGERFGFDVDQATGAVLHMAGSLRSGEPVSEMEWVTFESDVSIDPAIFDSPFPPGVTVQSHGEMLLALAAQRGLDTTGVDPEDEAQVQQLLGSGHRPRQPLEHHVPTGAPPVDEDAARAAITHAFAAADERDGDDLVHVQAGAGLAPYFDRARERFDAHFEVQAIKFLNATEAAVAYEVVGPEGNVIVPRPDGRALLLEGEWQIERQEFTSLLSFGGVQCPPPPDP